MPPTKKKRVATSKLDDLLRQGAANKRINVDKALMSSNDRLKKDKIEFTKWAESFDSVKEFRSDNIRILDAKNEAASRTRMKKILAEKMKADTPKVKRVSKKAKTFPKHSLKKIRSKKS